MTVSAAFQTDCVAELGTEQAIAKAEEGFLERYHNKEWQKKQYEEEDPGFHLETNFELFQRAIACAHVKEKGMEITRSISNNQLQLQLRQIKSGLESEVTVDKEIIDELRRIVAGLENRDGEADKWMEEPHFEPSDLIIDLSDLFRDREVQKFLFKEALRWAMFQIHKKAEISPPKYLPVEEYGDRERTLLMQVRDRERDLLEKWYENGSLLTPKELKDYYRERIEEYQQKRQRRAD